MANYAATQQVIVYNSLQEAVAGIETMLEATLITRANLKYDVVKTNDGKYAAWLIYTDVA